MKVYLQILFLIAGAGLMGCSQREAAVESPAATVAEEAPVRRADVRELRKTLPGASMSQVIKTLGKPSEVFTLDKERETWGYRDTVKDSITGSDVKFLEVLFADRVVRSVSFSY